MFGKIARNLITAVRATACQQQQQCNPSLGRWNLVHNDETQLERKVRQANEDHCGVCDENNPATTFTATPATTFTATPATTFTATPATTFTATPATTTTPTSTTSTTTTSTHRKL